MSDSLPPRPSDSPAAPPKRKRRLWWKVTLGLLLLLILLVILAPFLVASPLGRPLLLSQVNKNLHGNVAVDRLSLGWFSGAGASNILIKDDQGNIIARLSQLQTNLSLWSVLTGSYDFGKVIIRGDELHLVAYDDGTTNLSRLLGAATHTPSQPGTPPASPPSPHSSGPAKPTIIRADIDAQIKTITATAPNAPKLELENTALLGTLDTTGPVALDLKTIALNPDKSPVPIAAAAHGAFFDNGRLKPLASLRGNGKLVINDKLNIAPITPLLKAAGLDLTLTGAFRGNVQLADTSGQQTASAQWEITDNPTATGALLKGDTLRLQQLSGNFNAALTSDALDNMKLVLASNLFSATCSGSIKTAELGAGRALPPIAIQGQGNITELKKQLPTLLGDIPDTVVAVDLTGALDLAKKTYAVAADSAIKEVDPATGRGNTIALAKGNILSWGDVPSDATISIEYDLERLQGLLKDKLPDQTQLAGRHKMQVRLTGPLTRESGLRAFRKLSFDRTTLAFDKVYAQGVDLARGELALEMKNGIIALLPTSIPANGGSLNPHGRIDLNIDPPAYVHDQAAPRKLGENLQINKEIAGTWLAWLPLQWGNPAVGDPNAAPTLAQVAGLLNLQIDKAYIPLDGTLFKQKGTLTGTLDIQKLTTDVPFLTDVLKQLGPVARITQPDFLSIRGGNIQPVTFSLQDGRVRYQNLILGSDKASLRFNGSVGLDLTLDINMDLSLQANASGGGTLGDLARLAGGAAGRGGRDGQPNTLNLAIPVAIRGTIKKPQITISQDALNRTLQNVAPGVIDDLLNRNRAR